MKTTKRFLSVILALTMLVTSVTCINISAFATDKFSNSIEVGQNSNTTGLSSGMYKITTTENGNLTISFNHNTTSDDNYGLFKLWNIYLYSKDKYGAYNLIQKKENHRSDDKSFSFIPMYIEPTTIYIEIDTDEKNMLPYSINSTFEATNGEYETETNNTVETADILPLNSSIIGNTWKGEDVDWYQFTLTTKGKLDVIFNHNYVDDHGWWSIYIFSQNEDGTLNELQKFEYNKGIHKGVYFDTMGLNKGTYYIKVDTSTANSTDYIISNEFTPISNNEFETEFNDTFSTANTINLNDKIDANAFGKDEYDYYKITTTQHGNINLVFNHNQEDTMGDYWCVNFYSKNSNGRYEELYTTGNIFSIDEPTKSGTIKNLDAGTYYIKVFVGNANGNDYSLKNTFTHTHVYKVFSVKKATTSKNGTINYICPDCGATKTQTINSIKTITLSTIKYTYDGKAKKPTVTVKDSKGNKISSSNYTVAYSNNTKVGKATVKITFKGNYSGTKSLSFVINPKNTSISKLTAIKGGFKATIKKYTTQTTGYQIRYSTSSKMTKAKTVTVAKNTTTSKSVSKLAKGKKYYVQIRTYKTVGNTKYYSSWSKAKTVTTKK